MPEIRLNRKALLDRIAAAAEANRRDASEVSLVAVSKRQPLDRLRAAFEAGQTVFGENRVGEAYEHWQENFSFIRPEVELRLIGPLQSRKTADAVAQFDVIETLDREKIARIIADEAQKQGRLPRLLIQVNTGEEAQKSGLSPQDVPAFLDKIRSEYDLHPEGLMCIPPLNEAPGPHFALLKKMADQHGLPNISMGMSGDFETAVALGATHVRVGTAFFGAREE